MKKHIFIALKFTFASLVLFVGIYALTVLGIAQFTDTKGKPFTVSSKGKTYPLNIAQRFTSDQYFQSRPSAVDYNAAGSGGSNKGPSNPEYLALIQTRIDTFLVHNPKVAQREIPSELVTASGSGLDPHLSVQAALVQVSRIAHKRNLSEGVVRQLIQQYTEKPYLGIFGPEKVHVLLLNLALDEL